MLALMAEERTQRRLAAILAADVVGYSRLVEQDESGTLAAMQARFSTVVAPLLTRHQGRVFKRTGDGLLAEFSSVVNAVQCAIELQKNMAAANAAVPAAEALVFRIGVNLGDVVIDGDDIHGDGVNVAARLESIADPGGACISGSVFEQVDRRFEVRWEDLGQRALKNIARPVRVYRLAPDGPAPLSAGLRPQAAAPQKPSIAVLPFTNMSSDPEQGYFADGLSEDLITDLSKVPGLFVISRHSSFAYKGRSVDIRSIGRDLGVRFVVEGSVRRAIDRIRINVQLIEAEGGMHLWADRFDRDLADVFSLMDEVVTKSWRRCRVCCRPPSPYPHTGRPISKLMTSSFAGG